MKKYIFPLLTALMAISTCAIAAEEAPEVEFNKTKEFNEIYKEALTKRLGIKNLRIGSLSESGRTAIVIQFDGDITLRQARAILVESVETLQDLVEAYPEFHHEIPGAHTDVSKIALVVDTYDENKEKEQQFGVSSVLLIRGQVHFMGISHSTGQEVLMHKQPYSNAVIMNRAQKR